MNCETANEDTYFSSNFLNFFWGGILQSVINDVVSFLEYKEQRGGGMQVNGLHKINGYNNHLN